MNKRMRKKREKLRVYRVGDRVYTHKGLVMFGKERIGYVNAIELYHKIENPKLTRPRVKALVNYVYKHRMERIARSGYLPFIYLRFLLHLNELNRATTTPFVPYACNSCEAMSMEVD